MNVSRRRAAAALAAAVALPSFAESRWPGRPVRIVVPFGPGGIADLTARAVGQGLSARLGQPVVIDNRPGAGGITAGDLVARAEPDGTTLLLMSNGTAVTSALFRHLPFDALKDFAPVALLGFFDLAIVVPGNSKFRTLGELLAAARAQRGKLNLATINTGSTQNLAAELFKATAGVDMQVVPFNGTPAVVTALLGGQVDAAVEILGPIASQVQGRVLRALAVLGRTRSSFFPAVPTVADSKGPLAGFDVRSWNALAAPGRTKPEVVQRLSQEVQAVLQDPGIRQRLAALNVEAGYAGPQALAELLARDVRRWNSVIDRAGIARQ